MRQRLCADGRSNGHLTSRLAATGEKQLETFAQANQEDES